MFIRYLSEWTDIVLVQYLMYYLLILHCVSIIKILLFWTVRSEWTIAECNFRTFIYSSHLKMFTRPMRQNLYIVY